MAFKCSGDEVVGACLAFAAACLYCGTYLAVQIRNTNAIDFHVLRNLMLVAMFVLPKLCQKEPELLPLERKPRVCMMR